MWRATFAPVWTSLALFSIVGCATPTEQTEPPPRGTIATSATAPAVAQFDDEVALEATAPEAVSFSWFQTGGPGVRITDANAPRATFRAPSLETQATLRFVVTARGSDDSVGTADVKVVVAADPLFGQRNPPPPNGGGSQSLLFARAGADRSAQEGTTVTLDGGGSTGTGLTYLWRQVFGTTVALAAPTEVRTTFTAPAFVSSGTNRLEFELQVRDSAGRTSRDRVIITITRDSSQPPPPGPKTRVRFETTMGNFVIELEDQLAPRTVENFLQYVDDDFYDGLLIHRVVPGFVIQGGGYLPGLIEREPRDPVPSEADNGLSNTRTTVAMALSAGNPDSGTSQFFVNLVDNISLDAQQFTVFGRVVEGMTVVDNIATVPTTSRNGFNDVPVDDIIINDVVRLPAQ